MPLKKINPEDLVVGQEYYVKMKLRLKDDSGVPLCFEGVPYDECWFTKDQPIFTHEQSTDTDLEMLVNVASRLWQTKIYPTWNPCIKEAKEFITSCKNALKEVNQ